MLLSTAGLLIAGLLPLQESSTSEKARRSAEAARAITREFGLSRWSDKLLSRELAATTDSDARSQLLLARCDVLSAASNREFDVRKRIAARSEAGMAYVDFLATGPAAANLRAAQLELARITFAFGADVSDLFLDEALTEEQRKELLGTAEQLFTPALQAINAWFSWYDALPPDQKDDQRGAFNELSFYRSLTFLNWARLYPKGSLERSQYAGNALENLEDFALAAPRAPSMIAYKHVADAMAVRGDHSDAEDYYVYVIDSAIPEDPQATWPGAPPEFVDRQVVQLQGAVQDAYLGMLEMLKDSGQVARIPEVIEQFDAWDRDERPERNASGWRVRLLQAREMIESGRTAEAIELADDVARENQRTMLQLEANEVMAAAIAAAPPDAAIPLDILVQAAEGSYFSKDYWAAADGFRALIPRLAGSPQADEYGGKAYFYLGASWNQLGYPLLAGLAYEVGWRDYQDSGDEFVDRNAKAWLARADQMVAAAPQDEFLQQWYQDALNAQIVTPGKAQWMNAQRLAKTANSLAANAKSAPASAEGQKALQALKAAQAAYAAIPADDTYYEQAKVEIGNLLFEMIPFEMEAGERCLAHWQDYVDNYIPAHPPTSPAEQKVRDDSAPLGSFMIARTHRALAQAGIGDVDAHWRGVLARTDKFAERFPRQIPMAAAGHGYRIEAHLALGDVAAAEQEFVDLLALNPDTGYIAGAAYRLFLHFSPLPGEEALAKAQYYLHQLNANSSRLSWGNLRTEADLLLELGKAAEAEKVYQRVLDDFGSELGEGTLLSVRMKLVDALLAQRKLGVAVPIIEEVYAAKPNRLDVKQALIKIKLGFLVYENGRVIEVPGEASNLSDPEAAAAALKLATDEIGELLNNAQYQAGQQDPPISYYQFAPWWEAKLSQAYLFLLRGRVDAADAGKHMEIISGLEFQAPELGADVPGAGTRIARSFEWLKTQR